MTHDLKTWPEYFFYVNRGLKCFELRKDDRPFAVGDFVKLNEWDPRSQSYTGRTHMRQIFYILRGAVPGLEAGYCILGL